MGTIKIPNNIKSPTVIIVGNNPPDEKKNDQTMRRMDLLERKLDQQYKAYTDKTEYVKLIENLQKSFMSSLDKLISMNKSINDSNNSKRIEGLRKEFNLQIKSIPNNDAILKVFANRLGSLETSIKNIPAPQVKVVRNDSLGKSFESAFSRLEELIRKMRPGMMPSPS